MISTFARFAVAVLMLVETDGQAQPVGSGNGLFPTDGSLRASGATTVVNVGPTAADALRISPVTFLRRAGTNNGESSKSMCGLVIVSPGRRLQGVITVGTGATEATPSCDAVLAVGAVQAVADETVRRIGAIHAVSSRNAADGRAAIILRRDGAGTWSVDEDATVRADTITHHTIAELRRKLH